ncbi:hypothetical protein JCM8547_000338 [Rhodosporidiobolus lusitaniae]
MDSEFDLSQSQFTQTQTQQTQPYSQGASQQPQWPTHLFGLLVPVAGTSSFSSNLSSSAAGAGAPHSAPPAGNGYANGAAPSLGNGGAVRARLELDRKKNLYAIGRHPRADLVLQGPKISSRHAEVTLDERDGSVRLRDLSTNGTFVRGHKVGKGNVTILETGDSIVFGPASANMDDEFRYVFQGPSTSTASSDPYGLGELSQGSCGIFQDYEVREQLGKGSFATVRKGVRRSDGQIVAIKIIAKARFSSNPQTLNMFQREIQIAKSLDHPFCVKCYDCYEDDQRIWLVLEFVDGGDLLDYVMKRGGLKETEVRELALMICQAVAYLHSKGITHRDLKPENLLLTKGPRPHCKVTDFGLAKMVNEGTMLKTMCGTPTYLAPEVIIGNSAGIGYRDIVDAYSVGVILYSCLTNQTPFDESESTPLPERMKHRNVDLNIPRSMGVSETCLDFLSKLLRNDPSVRMSCQAALEHPWLVTKDRTTTPSLPFSLGSSLPFNAGTAGAMLPPALRGNGRANGIAAGGEEDGDVLALQSAASITSPAMSTRMRDEGEDSMVDSQDFGNLRIAHSDLSLTTASTSAFPSGPSSRDPPAPPAPPALAPLPESTERVVVVPLVSHFSNSVSPQVAGVKRNVASAFSDSSLSELPSQPSQEREEEVKEVDFAAAVKEREASGMQLDGVPEEKKQEDEEKAEVTEEGEPSTTEEADPPPPASTFPTTTTTTTKKKLPRAPRASASPVATRRSSRGSGGGASAATNGSAKEAATASSTPARRSGRGRASSAGTTSSNGAESVASASVSGSPEVEMGEGIAAGVKSRRRKAARYN